MASATVLALSAHQQLASAKCLGSGCTGMEKDAADNGLLASSSNTCRGRDRTFDFDPKWRVRVSVIGCPPACLLYHIAHLISLVYRVSELYNVSQTEQFGCLLQHGSDGFKFPAASIQSIVPCKQSVFMQTQLQSELQVMEWSGGDDQWVWAVTTGSTADMAEGQFHHIYWSDDYGFTMTDRFEDLKQLVKDKIGSDYDPSTHDLHASVSKIFVNSKDPKRVVLWGEGSYAYESKDGGKTLEIVSVPENTYGMSHQVRQHPTQADWMLSLAYRNSCYDSSSPGCSMDLWLTKDFARSWTNLTEKAGGAVSGFLDFDWGYHTDDQKYADIFEEGTILATGHTNEYKTTLDVISEDIALYRSDDDFKNIEKLASCGAAFELVAGQVLLHSLCRVEPVDSDNATF